MLEVINRDTLKGKNFILILILTFLLGCSASRHVPKGSFLLSEVALEIDDERVDAKEAKYYIKQKTNTKIFSILKLNLAVYNMSGADETKGINKFLRRLGEPPVVYDSLKTKQTVVQLERFMQNKGFYNAEIRAVPRFFKKKVNLLYKIKANTPKKISRIIKHKDSLSYKVVGRSVYAKELEDTTRLRKTLFSDSITKLEIGTLFDINKLKGERSQLTNYYKEKGYYKFSEDNVHFYADTTAGVDGVNLSYGLRVNRKDDTVRYKIKQVVVNLLGRVTFDKKVRIDSLYHKDLLFLYQGKIPYKTKLLQKAISIHKNDWYNPKEVERTKKNLTELQQFKYISVRFVESKTTDNSTGWLTCYIQLNPMSRQSYGLEATVTYNSGDLGFRQGLFYQHKNLFKGAEIFNFKLVTGFEQLKAYDMKNFAVKEYGGEVKLITPKFFLPWLKAENWRAKSPRTAFSLLFNHTQRPEYERTITDINFSYRWKDGRGQITHLFTPLDLGVLKVDADANFIKNLNDYYRETSYVDHIISASRYTLLYNNKGKSKKTTYQRFRFNVEVAGNFLSLINYLSESKEETIGQTNKTNAYYSYFGIRYAQYFKTELDFSYNHFIDRNNTLVYHFATGVGVPYGNSDVIPFEKMYFAGGANSMRAWASRSLGPGTSQNYAPSYRISYGEMKLEVNLEYRFKVIDKFEGALFVDAGNIWNISSSLVEKDKNAGFFFNDFYKQIAVGTGLGLRLDVSNIILRFDAGLKLIDPYEQEGKRFVPTSSKWRFEDVSFNFGVGYPF